MIIVPSLKAAICNLNSYFIDMEKLIEHYQAELSSGGIYLKSHTAEGIIFFNEEMITNVFFQEKDHLLDGIPARNELISNLKIYNFMISVYPIEPDKLHYWENVSYAQDLYSNLGTDATPLDGLIKRLNAENLIGYAEVAITGGSDTGLIFFNSGHIIGITCSWDQDEPFDTRQKLHHLILKSKNQGAVVNVKRIDSNRFQGHGGCSETAATPSTNAADLLQIMLSTLETLVASEKRIKMDFDTLLKKKFFEKANSYEFLDPFAAEVRYADRAFEFTPEVPLEQLVKGVSESALELADDVGLLGPLMQKLSPLKKKYQNEITRFGIKI